MQKPFNKYREHYQVPLLLVLVNFYGVAVIFYGQGYIYQHLSAIDINKALLSGIALVLIMVCLFKPLGGLGRITCWLSLLSLVYIFWGT